MSTTSYAATPQTHRVNNIGTSLFRLIGITNASAGDDSSTPSPGFDTAPELSNRWFRGYRWSLIPDTAAEHRHSNPVVVVLVTGSAAVRANTAAARALEQPGDFVFLEPNAPHTIQPSGGDAEVVEIEIRRPRPGA
jgi:hypothetical protein